MHHFIPRNWPDFVSATRRQIVLRLHSVRYWRAWVRVGGFVWDEEVAPPQHHRDVCKDRLRVTTTRACNNKSDCLIRGRWFPGMQLIVRSTPLRLAERLSPSKRLTSTKWSKVHILSLITKNCLSWISGKKRKTIYIFSWLMRRKLHVLPVCGMAGARTSDPLLCSQTHCRLR